MFIYLSLSVVLSIIFNKLLLASFGFLLAFYGDNCNLDYFIKTPFSYFSSSTSSSKEKNDSSITSSSPFKGYN